ncbi:MAG: hypothetical protein HKO92_08820 [Flavobacteriaceae bacterium]|nr:hypothetical protein [Bacteroidia bacterium]NNK83214.1 hypothetical protein [Flavobacteriaceae bacterium]
MKSLYLILIVLVLFSCSEKVIQLPETTNKDILKVEDVSSIYMFYNEAKDSLEFNRKNMISTTNWLVAVDKRLILNQVLPHLQYLYEKRHGESMHENKEARNYFSCSNPEIQNLTLLDFTDVKYQTTPIADFLLDLFSKPTTETNPLYVNVKTEDSVIVGSQMFVKTTSKENLVSIVDSLSKSNTVKDELFLTFKEDLTFQDYIAIKTLTLELNPENVYVANTEFIYN